MNEPIILTCTCGTEFVKNPYRVHIYCCKKCADTAYYKEHKDLMNKNRKEKYRLKKILKQITDSEFKSHLSDKLKMQAIDGISYGDRQRAETLKLVGRVVV